MHASLQTIFTKIEADRTRLLSSLSNLPDDLLTHSPAPSRWSVNQILTHIVASEKISIGYIKKKALGMDTVGNSGILEAGKLGLLKISQRLPLRYRAPRVVVDNTPPALPLPELIQQWNDVRTDIRRFIETLEDKNIRKKLYKHPVMGRLDVGQAMLFMNEHVHHHWPQVKRLLNKS
jgi:hypothetical protein